MSHNHEIIDKGAKEVTKKRKTKTNKKSIVVRSVEAPIVGMMTPPSRERV